MLKQCRTCKVEKSLNSFHRDSRSADARNSRCKACTSEYMKNRHSPIGREHLRKPDKLCNACKERKDKSEFYKSDNACKPCRKDKDKGRKRNRSVDADRAHEAKRRGAPFRAGVPAFMRKHMTKCAACGATENLEIDHVMPLALGGTSALKNLQMLCKTCNTRKGATYVDYRYLGLELR